METDRMLRPEELAELLGINTRDPRRTIRRYVQDGKVPPPDTRLSRREPRWLASRFQEWLRSQTAPNAQQGGSDDA